MPPELLRRVAAHRSQLGSGLNAHLLRLPPRVFGLIFSHEWFIDPTATPQTSLRTIFDSNA
jgi:hypothetical protein